jgi:hypothetical protein
MRRIHDERVKQAAIGVGILLTLTACITGTLLGWGHLPGLLGQWFGTMIGIATTPFFMEASFILLGLFIVIGLNSWRRHKEGDEFVYLEQVIGPDVPKNLPDQATWAIYEKKPLDCIELTPLELAEGALDISDFDSATKWIGTMDQEQLNRPDTLDLRLKLAKATGKTDLVNYLESVIRESNP